MPSVLSGVQVDGATVMELSSYGKFGLRICRWVLALRHVRVGNLPTLVVGLPGV